MDLLESKINDKKANIGLWQRELDLLNAIETKTHLPSSLRNDRERYRKWLEEDQQELEALLAYQQEVAA